MKQSRSWGRRKMDKGVWIIATLAVSALALTYTQSCNDEGPTEPSPVHTQTLPTAQTSAQESPAETTPTPAPEGGNPGPVSMEPNGKNTCSAILKNSATGAPRFVKVKYTEPGTEKVQYIPEQTFTVPAGGTFITPSAQQLFEEKELTFDPDCLWEQEVQCDFTAGQGEHIGHLGEIVILEDPECDECVEWQEPRIVCGEWGECHEHEDDGLCYEHAECEKRWNCKDPEPFEDIRTCDCPVCVEEGPYEGSIVWSGIILPGTCPAEFNFNCLPPQCHELGEQTVTWDCQDPTIVPHCRPSPCDDPECILPPEGMVLSWSGPGDPESECAAFGPPFYVPGPPTDFYLCKSGNDREVMYSYPTGATCSNGKTISHVTECGCPPQ